MSHLNENEERCSRKSESPLSKSATSVSRSSEPLHMQTPCYNEGLWSELDSDLIQKSVIRSKCKSSLWNGNSKGFYTPLSGVYKSTFDASQLNLDPNTSEQKNSPDSSNIGVLIFFSFLLIGLITLFVLSDRRSADLWFGLSALRNEYVPVSCKADERYNYKIIHMDCSLKHLPTFYPPYQFFWNLDAFKGVFLEMKVEMFQWVLVSNIFGFFFFPQWSSHLVNSSTFPFLFYNAHKNPEFFPHVYGAGRKFPSEVYAGDYKLSQHHIVEFRGKRKLDLHDDGVYIPSSERPPTDISYVNTQVHDNSLYTGDPYNPSIGDIKITFWGSTATHASAIARQIPSFTGLSKTYELALASPPNETTLKNVVAGIIYEGDLTPEEIITKYIKENDVVFWVTWTIRITLFVYLTCLLCFTSYLLWGYQVLFKLKGLISSSAVLSIGFISLISSLTWLTYDKRRSTVLIMVTLVCCAISHYIFIVGGLKTEPSQMRLVRTSSENIHQTKPLELSELCFTSTSLDDELKSTVLSDNNKNTKVPIQARSESGENLNVPHDVSSDGHYYKAI